MPTKQKKSSAKKPAPVKKKSLATKKVVSQKPVAVPAVKTTVQPEVKKEVRPKKVYEISAFFHALIVIIVIILYAEIALLSVLYFNYDVRIESKSLIAMHQQNVVKPTLKRTIPQ